MSLRVVHLDRHFYGIKSPGYDHTLVEACRMIPGVHWEGAAQAWIGYADGVAAVCRLLKAQGVDVEDSAELTPEFDPNKMIELAPIAYEGLRPSQVRGVKFLMRRAPEGAILAWAMACVDGAAVVEVRRADSHFPETIPLQLSELFLWWSTGRTGLRVRTLCGDSFGYQKITAVLDKGMKPVVKITLASGATLRVTADHEIATIDTDDSVVFTAAGELQYGEYVVIYQPGSSYCLSHVSSVVADGEAHVYDIVCKDPHRNFVANGIVVHNCGKTATAIRTVRALKIPALVVCPNPVRGVWGDGDNSQVKRWWKEAWPPRMLSGTKPQPLYEWQREQPNYVETDPPSASVPSITVIHYDILHAWAETVVAEGWARFVIFDEGHVLSNPKSRRSKAAKLIARAASHRVVLSGTPMTNRPADLHNVIDTISEDRMGWFHFEPPPTGKRWAYSTRYCDAHREQVTRDKAAWIFKGSSHEDELNYRLGFFMDRLTKDAIASELPPKIRQVIDIDIGRVRGADPAAAIVGDKLDPRALRRTLEVAADAKIPKVIEMIIDSAGQGNKIIAFTYRRLVAEQIAEALAGAGFDATFIHGGVTQKKRDERIKRQPAVLAATVDTMGVGVDLSWAQVGYMVEPTYEAWEMAQAEDRLHRPGSTGTTIIYPIARGSLDELVVRQVCKKLETMEKIIGPAGTRMLEDLQRHKEEGSKSALKGLFEAIMRGAAAKAEEG